MNKIKNGIYKFMQGRYGVDELYYLNFTLYFILLLINMFLNNIVLTSIEIVLAFILLYRFFSKNTKTRAKENKRYVNFKTRIKRKFTDKTNVYKKCSKCKTTLKLPLPKKAGINHVKCPECGQRLTLFSLRKQRKVKVIKKG